MPKNPVVIAYTWLKKRPIINIGLVLIYGIALIILHDSMVQLSIKAMNNLGMMEYNLAVKWFCLGFGVVLVGVFAWGLLKSTENTFWKIFFLSSSGALLVIHFLTMLEMNIEMIHALEFTILAFLLLPLVGSFGGAIIFCLPFILVNEWYQYTVLYPNYIKYFEFNDIILDLLGCGIAMVSLWIMGLKPKQGKKPFWKKPELGLLAFINLSFALALGTCFLSMYTSTQCGNTFLVLNQLENPQLFWQTHSFTGAVYHVFTPIEGLVSVSLLCLFYMGMDSAAGSNAN